MGKTKYNRAKEFLSKIKEEKGEVVPFEIFKEEVTKKIGADEQRTVKPYMKMMMEFKLVSAEGADVRING